MVRVAALIVALWAAALSIAAVSHAANPAPLKYGSHGPRVRSIQWLLTGNQPSHYSIVHPLRGHKPNGVYGKRTADAVAAAKWRLGYPAHEINRRAGQLLFNILLGKTRRPIAWISTAAARQARLEHQIAAAKVSACQRQVVQVAESQIGVHEEPWGSNWGPQVANYQAVTGAYHAPWCASWAQWVTLHAGYGTFANRSAGVYYIRSWAYQRGLLRATPRPGVLVIFLTSSGHIGIVESVSRYGFVSIEGNSGNMVARRYHPFSRATVFVYLPHCSQATKITAPPSNVLGLFNSKLGLLISLLVSLGCWFAPQPHQRFLRRRK
jgi:hypothetical protein